METKFIKALVMLGIPGVALGVFFLLLRKYTFIFSKISPTLTAVTAILFLIITGCITFYALHRYAPKKNSQQNSPSVTQDKDCPKVHKFKTLEEVSTVEELMISLSHDILKINAHSYRVGMLTEYAYLKEFYKGCELLSQGLSTLELLKNSKKYDISQVHFDIHLIKLKDGREKEILFDISSFFNDSGDPFLNDNEFLNNKLKELYN